MKHCCSLLLPLVLSACIGLPAVETPLPHHFYPASDTPSETLVVFLPGRGDQMDAFEVNGFVERLQKSAHPLDAVALDAHMGYYRAEVLAEQAYRDVLAPYLEKGYQRFILVGTSMGGFGAVRINDTLSGFVGGVVLIAPFLGGEATVTEVTEAGSVAAWRDGAGQNAERADLVWVWIERAIACQQGQKFVLAWGANDRHAQSAELLADQMPGITAFTAKGGHNWATWQPLWEVILQSDTWQRLSYTKDNPGGDGNCPDTNSQENQP